MVDIKNVARKMSPMTYRFPLLVLFISVLVVSGCGLFPKSQTPLKSDFVPPVTLAPNPDPELNGPQDKMIKIATSSDGLNFKGDDEILSRQANAPGVVLDAQGRILVYYSGWIIGDRLNRPGVAVSNDGTRWIYKYLDITGDDGFSKPTDIAPVKLDDGTIRIYFTSGNPSVGSGIHYAESSNGTSFVYKGAVFAPKGASAKNPIVFQGDGLWHLYASSDDKTYPVWHLTSTDGVNFEVYALTDFPVNGKSASPSGGLWLGERYQLFLSTQDSGVTSFSTENGTDWIPDDGLRLTRSSKERYVADPTVVQLGPDRFLMVYTTTGSN